MFVKHS